MTIVLGVAGLIVASLSAFWLAASNPTLPIPQPKNRNFAAAMILYGLGVAIAIGGWIVFGGNPLVFLVLGVILLPLPLQIARRRHNRSIPGALS